MKDERTRKAAATNLGTAVRSDSVEARRTLRGSRVSGFQHAGTLSPYVLFPLSAKLQPGEGTCGCMSAASGGMVLPHGVGFSETETNSRLEGSSIGAVPASDMPGEQVIERNPSRLVGFRVFIKSTMGRKSQENALWFLCAATPKRQGNYPLNVYNKRHELQKFLFERIRCVLG